MKSACAALPAAASSSGSLMCKEVSCHTLTTLNRRAQDPCFTDYIKDRKSTGKARASPSCHHVGRNCAGTIPLCHHSGGVGFFKLNAISMGETKVGRERKGEEGSAGKKRGKKEISSHAQ